MRRPTLALGMATGLLALVACQPVETVCTDDLRTSIQMHVVDDAGNPVEGLAPEYAVDGGDFQLCVDNGGGDYSCGFEEAGLITIEIDDADFEFFETELQVDEDECHVITEELEVELVMLEG